MSIFIKAGLWSSKIKGHLGELNLTKFVKDLIAETPVEPSVWTKDGDDIINNNTGKVDILAEKSSSWEFTEGVYMFSGNASVYLEKDRDTLELSGSFSHQYFNDGGISFYAPTNKKILFNSGSTLSNKVSISVSQEAGEFKVTDNRATPRTGLEYAEDYSTNYTDRSLVDKAFVVNQKSYKVYTALLTQTGTNAPVAIVLENTIGNIIWTRYVTGSYEAKLAGAFVTNKTVIFNGNALYNNAATVTYGGGTVVLDVRSFTTNTPVDGAVSGMPIEIRVYN